jgi:hypothetical protein
MNRTEIKEIDERVEAAEAATSATPAHRCNELSVARRSVTP